MDEIVARIRALAPDQLGELAGRLGAGSREQSQQRHGARPTRALALEGADAEALLARLPSLSDEEVDSLLQELVGADGDRKAAAPTTPSAGAEQLLAQIDELSDSGVDALLAELLNGEEKIET